MKVLSQKACSNKFSLVLQGELGKIIDVVRRKLCLLSV